jgi:hypothetical protein
MLRRPEHHDGRRADHDVVVAKDRSAGSRVLGCDAARATDGVVSLRDLARAGFVHRVAPPNCPSRNSSRALTRRSLPLVVRGRPIGLISTTAATSISC